MINRNGHDSDRDRRGAGCFDIDFGLPFTAVV
jgi:hypothetical protein